MSMQECPECGKFYDTECFPENLCAFCFDKEIDLPRKEKQCKRCQYYREENNYCIAAENTEYTTPCLLKDVIKSLGL